MLMQKTQRKDAVRNIFKRKISYLSILLTITLGVTGLLCIFFLGISMEKVATAYYAESHFRDIEITASLGLSEEDLNAVRGLEQIADGVGTTPSETAVAPGAQLAQHRYAARAGIKKAYRCPFIQSRSLCPKKRLPPEPV